MRVVDMPSAAHQVLPSAVALPDPAPRLFEAMLDGWGEAAAIAVPEGYDDRGALGRGASVSAVHGRVPVGVAAGGRGGVQL